MSPQDQTRAQRREAQEPTELSNPVPWPVAVIAIGFILWGFWYYFQNVGYPAMAGDRRSAIVIDPSASFDGSVVYAGNCAACHQGNGKGLAGVFPPLAGSEWVLKNDDRLVQILLHGINGEIEVAGATYQGVMPAFPQLVDGELAAVLSFIRSEWGNTAAPITAAAVEAGRQRFADRDGPWQGGAELNEVFPPES
ncbi:MAG: cytochrome c [Pseudomonadota bacterium]